MIVFTKDEYTAWLKRRGPTGTWNIEECVAADRLIKQATLSNAANWIAKHVHQDAQAYLKDMLNFHFGSVETDLFLTQIKAYPEWIEHDEGGLG